MLKPHFSKYIIDVKKGMKTPTEVSGSNTIDIKFEVLKNIDTSNLSLPTSDSSFLITPSPLTMS